MQLGKTSSPVKPLPATKFIVVVGGVLSGVGKGIVTSSIGRLLKSKGFKVTALKIDPYLNVDAGTMRPSEHGEVWVTEDGGEIDQDLGNYERFLDASLGKDNNLTTGKLYLSVIEKERKGEFLGKTVQPIPHLVDEVISRIETASKGFDFCVIEVGGTTGDLENAIYLEAMRRMKWVKGLQVAYAMVAHLPVISTIGEQKTKPAQHAVSSLRAAGILPDFFFARSRMPLDEVRKEKLVQQCGVPHSNIIDCPDLDSAYKVPLLFERQGLGEALLRFFSLPARESDLTGWREFVSRLDSSEDSVKIAIVGKYVEDGSTSSHEDVYLSVKEALVHAGASTGVKVSITSIPSTHFDPGKLREFDGILVPGGFGATGVEGKIAAARFARENNVPYLGICYGMQLAIVEIARSLCGFADAHTSEVDRETKHPVIDLLPEQKSVDRKGGTMRLGSYSAELKKDSLVHSLYSELGLVENNSVKERHRHRFEVNPSFIPALEKAGVVFSGYHKRADGQTLQEFIEFPANDFFVGTQAHPEFKSRPNKPSPLYYGFVRAAKNYALQRAGVPVSA